MSPVQSIKPSVVCGAFLGVSIAVESLSPKVPRRFDNHSHPDAEFHSFASSGVPGERCSGPGPVLEMAQYLQRGAHEDPDVILLLEDIQKNFNQALDELSKATPGSLR